MLISWKKFEAVGEYLIYGTSMQKPQLVKGNMQLFSVEQQRSQALEAHAAAFASFKVCAFSWIMFFYSMFQELKNPSWRLHDIPMIFS